MSEELRTHEHDQPQEQKESDLTRDHMVALAVDSEAHPMDVHTLYGTLERPGREEPREFVENIVDSEEGNSDDINKRSQRERQRVVELKELWEDQDAFIKDRTDYYDALYAVNPEKFSAMSVDEFLESARQERSLYDEVHKQELERTFISEFLTGLDEIEESYTRLSAVDISSLNSAQFVDFGTEFSKLQKRVIGLNNLQTSDFHSQSINHHLHTPARYDDSESSRAKLSAWVDFAKYGGETDAWIEKMKDEAQNLTPLELVDRARELATNLEERQTAATQNVLDEYNTLIAGIRS